MSYMDETTKRLYHDAVARDIDREIPVEDKHRRACNLEFAHQRIEEGVEIASYLEREYPKARLTALDLGTGNGGVALGLRASAEHVLVAVDIAPNVTLSELERQTGLYVHQVIAEAARLPFRASQFDVVLCLETIEHVERAASAAEEIMRVLKSGGQTMITTPARLRFLFRRDPHYGVPFLLTLPDRAQRFLFERLLRRGTYDVAHIYTFAHSIARLFPRRARTETLTNAPWPPPPRRGTEWLQLIRHHVFKRLRQVLWDRIVIYKA